MLQMFIFLSIFLQLVKADELVLVQAVWRHGDKSPGSKTYKTDPNKGYDWGVAEGELTNLGMQQQYHQGTKLRQRYMIDTPFLNKTYWASDVYIQASDGDRTIMSAYANLAGMYANSNGTYPKMNGWPTNWTPIPVHMVAGSKDYICDENACPRIKQRQQERLFNKIFLKFALDGIPLLLNLSNACCGGLEFDGIGEVFTVLPEEIEHNMTLPSWFTPEFYKQITDFVYPIADYYSYGGDNFDEPADIEHTTLMGGPLLQKIVENMQKAINRSKSTKYYAYSAHDYSVAAQLYALGAKKAVMGNVTVDYAATVLYELWRTGAGAYKVKVLFADNSSTDFYTITQSVSNCTNEEFCPFETFLERSKPYFPWNIQLQCIKHLLIEEPNQIVVDEDMDLGKYFKFLLKNYYQQSEE